MGSPRMTAKLFREVLPKAVRYPDGTIVLGSHNLKLYGLKGSSGEAAWVEHFQEQDNYKFSSEADLIGWLSDTLGQIEHRALCEIGRVVNPSQLLFKADHAKLAEAFLTTDGLGLTTNDIIKILAPGILPGIHWERASWSGNSPRVTHSASCTFRVFGLYEGVVESSNFESSNEYEISVYCEGKPKQHERFAESGLKLDLDGLKRRTVDKYLRVVIEFVRKASW